MSPRSSITPAVVAGCLLLLTACGGSDDTATTSAVLGTPQQTAAPADTTGESTDATIVTSESTEAWFTPGSEPAVPPSAEVLDAICDTVPPLEVINAVLDEPATRVTDLERGPGWDLCEAASDGVSNVQFSRSTTGTKEEALALAAQLGATVVALTDPTLPRAFTYSGVVVIYIDGVEYSAQVTTLDTITDPTSPAAVERSASLLRAWLANLGLA